MSFLFFTRTSASWTCMHVLREIPILSARWGFSALHAAARIPVRVFHIKCPFGGGEPRRKGEGMLHKSIRRVAEMAKGSV